MGKGTVTKKPSSSRKHSVYANLVHKRKTKKDAEARKRAEYLASLPKHPVKRFFYRLHPKRLAKYWFSKRGALMALKILGVTILLMVLFVGGLFAYFRKDLDQIRPEELAKRVQTTVTTYLDRNGNVLWEDKGAGNYKLVVESKDISNYLKEATVAIEDRDFYKHNGVSPTGILRAMVNNTGGSGGIQGGSTLTQQLVKQVFFADQAGERGLAGIPRKIKEAILAIEVERMYNKDQILTLYLNESPYGGPRNGAESGAQAYFHKSAKDLTLAEASLLAAIPQNPSLYNPYSANTAGHQALVARQHAVLDAMVHEDFISQKEADDAKKVAILDSIYPEADQFANVKAPHFVQAVRAQLEKELGKATVGKGGLTVKTTLDIRIQEKLESEMKSFFDSGVPGRWNISNGAATIEDTQTGQIVAMLGSKDFHEPGFGQDNAAISYIQPGSTVKPFVFAKLFEDKGAGQQNYGSGSILKDEPIDNIYRGKLYNWDNKFMGNLTIRQGLALSRNIPAVKAMYLNRDANSPDGIKPTIDKIHEIGASSYCDQEMAGGGIGLSSAIGACGVKQVDLVNAYATLGRMGVYKPTATILEVKNSSGEVIKQWKDESKQVLDPQIAYIIGDILSDPQARAALHGPNPAGIAIPGVKTAAKTGTSDRDSKPKDLWIANYGPALSMAMWLGNSDSSLITTTSSSLGGPVVGNTLSYAYKEVYAAEGKWKPDDWFTRPDGIQQQGKELYPSWWNKSQGQSKEKMTFDQVSKKKATSCTPDAAKVELEVTKVVDPVTKKDTFIAPDGYDATKDDDAHSCDDPKPSITISGYSGGTVNFSVSGGKFSVTTIDIAVNGNAVSSVSAGASSASVPGLKKGDKITITVRDSGYYTATSNTYTVSGGSDGPRGRDDD